MRRLIKKISYLFSRFPYGKAPFIILLIAVITGGINLSSNFFQQKEKVDLVFTTFARGHKVAYENAVGEFEKKYNCKVRLQLVNIRALKSRLQSAFLTDGPVPDLVEIEGFSGSMGYFTRGPLKDIGFVDLTDRLREEKIYERLVKSRYGMWTSRGRIFALPHDVHPVMLCYRRDLVEKLGIDVKKIETWDDFVKIGQRVTKDLDGDGNPDRYMFELPQTGQHIQLLLMQKGGGLFDKQGNVTFDSDMAVDVVLWYIQQMNGKNPIAFSGGRGQNYAKVMLDGFILFYLCPDWRTKWFKMLIPQLKGKLALMPLPAWEKGGIRTSTWGGSGLAITKACKKQELAWELAKYLYLNKEELGKRFIDSHIIPPFKDAWNLPEFQKPFEFYSGQKIGLMYTKLAPSTPSLYISPYQELAGGAEGRGGKLSEAYLNCLEYYKKNGEKGLRQFTKQELKRCADYVRNIIDRNVFLKEKVVE